MKSIKSLGKTIWYLAYRVPRALSGEEGRSLPDSFRKLRIWGTLRREECTQIYRYCTQSPVWLLASRGFLEFNMSLFIKSFSIFQDMVIHHSCYTYVNKQVKFIKLELFASELVLLWFSLIEMEWWEGEKLCFSTTSLWISKISAINCLWGFVFYL